MQKSTKKEGKIVQTWENLNNGLLYNSICFFFSEKNSICKMRHPYYNKMKVEGTGYDIGYFSILPLLLLFWAKYIID